ncbi:natriuretic peptides B [Notolabrus celidotus]|uniref:natriuretic peptides B n=1 Tax=Notolabrus celidotus TaxID=1203425 RepID=UPI00148FB9F5|nr:natriuretic peptides B [Notolabrus celidotus]
MPVQFLTFLREPGCSIKEWRGAAVASNIQTATRERRQRASNQSSLHPSADTRNSERNMHLCTIPVCSLLLILNLQLISSYPVSTGLTDTDLDILKVILNRLEESVSEQTEVDQRVSAERDSLDGDEAAADVQQPQIDLDEEMIREFLSAKNLKSVRNNDSSKRSSGCFGRRMDRIGSMSSLGCNTVGKYNPK